MSTSFSPSRDLVLHSRVPAVTPLFSTFSTGHFIRPGPFTQPVRHAGTVEVQTSSFAGRYSEVYAAAAIELDYDEPNAACAGEFEFLKPGNGVTHLRVALGN